MEGIHTKAGVNKNLQNTYRMDMDLTFSRCVWMMLFKSQRCFSFWGLGILAHANGIGELFIDGGMARRRAVVIRCLLRPLH